MLNLFCSIARKVSDWFSIRSRDSLVFGNFFDELEHRNPSHMDDEGPATVQPIPFDETARRAEFTGCRDNRDDER